MDDQGRDAMLQKLDERLERVEQILPTLATSTGVDATVTTVVTKTEFEAAVARLATKQELEAAVARLATKEELEAAVARLATKEELEAAVGRLATKEELSEVRTAIREEGVATRQYFDVVADDLRECIARIGEGYSALDDRLDRSRSELTAADAALDVRVTALEAAPTRRRRER